MNMYCVSMEGPAPLEKYKSANTLATSFAHAVEKVQRAFPEYTITGVSKEGDYVA